MALWWGTPETREHLPDNSDILLYRCTVQRQVVCLYIHSHEKVDGALKIVLALGYLLFSSFDSGLIIFSGSSPPFFWKSGYTEGNFSLFCGRNGEKGRGENRNSCLGASRAQPTWMVSSAPPQPVQSVNSGVDFAEPVD